MKHLELKIPPLLWLAVFAALMKLCCFCFPGMGTQIPLANELSIALLGLGLSFCLGGVWAVRRAESTIDPRRPETTSSLVDSGIYAVTRNPMYVGMLLGLSAWAVHLQNILALGLVALFMTTLSELQIKPEERLLEARFAELYLDYRRRVPRWLFGSAS